MPNAQIISPRRPAIPPETFIRINIIDNGTSVSFFVEERENSDYVSDPASITAAGKPLLAAPPIGGVTGSGTTNTLLKWIDGPESECGDSRISDDEITIRLNSGIGDVQIGDLSGLGNQTQLAIADSSGSLSFQSFGRISLRSTITASFIDFLLGDVNASVDGSYLSIHAEVGNGHAYLISSLGESSIGDPEGLGNGSIVAVHDDTQEIEISNGIVQILINTIMQVFGNIEVIGYLSATSYKVGATPGVDGTFTSQDGKTITVEKGIITEIV
jgi:hypothetical protein